MALPTAQPPVLGHRPTPRRELSSEVARVLDLARHEAAERGHHWIGTAHLLRALVRVDGPEAGLLAAAGVTERDSDTALTLAVWSAVAEPGPSGPPGPPRANEVTHEVLRAAHARAADLEHAAVSVSDLLSALLEHGEDQAADMLATLGADATRLLDALAGLDALLGPAPTGSERPPAPVTRITPRDPGALLSTAWPPEARSA